VKDHLDIHKALGSTKMIGLFSVAPTHQVWVHQMADSPIPFPKVSHETPAPRILLRAVELEDEHCHDFDSELAILCEIYPPSICWKPRRQDVVGPSAPLTPPPSQPFDLASLGIPASKNCGIFSTPFSAFPLETTRDMVIVMEFLDHHVKWGSKGSQNDLVAAFAKALPLCSFNYVTVNRHHSVYRWALKFGLLDAFVDAGDEKEGKWKLLREKGVLNTFLS
jgi:hypothetical protein